MYIWLCIAIYTHIYSIYSPKRCAQYLHNACTPRKLVHATLGLYSYGIAKPTSIWRFSVPAQLPCNVATAE